VSAFIKKALRGLQIAGASMPPLPLRSMRAEQLSPSGVHHLRVSIAGLLLRAFRVRLVSSMGRFRNFAHRSEGVCPKRYVWQPWDQTPKIVPARQNPNLNPEPRIRRDHRKAGDPERGLHTKLHSFAIGH
jgi:hypothetical protein